MAVMYINNARYEHDKAKRLTNLNEAETLISNVLDLDRNSARAYINYAEVCFLRIRVILGLEYEKSLSSIDTLPNITDLNQNEIESLLFRINEYLKNALYRNPKMPNPYYKMIQLQSYRIFYYRIKSSDKKSKAESEKKIENYIHEAEKWICSVSTSIRSLTAYLWVCEEYYCLTDPDRAKENIRN